FHVTGVQTCALPISGRGFARIRARRIAVRTGGKAARGLQPALEGPVEHLDQDRPQGPDQLVEVAQALEVAGRVELHLERQVRKRSEEHTSELQSREK